MKKVFACLSAFVLMLVTFGLLVQPANVSAAAVEDGKFIEDPTLEEGEMPLYVMNSIRTSFPQLYDYNAQPDPNYGLGRDYYWNEIKVVFPEFSAAGATGKFWSVYTQGAYQESKKTAAATKIYLWAVNKDGEIQPATQTGSSIDFTGSYAKKFGDTSLSGVRYNVTGQEVVLENYYTEYGIINGPDSPYSTDAFYIIVNGDGKVVRGIGHDNYYAAENVELYGYSPIFGYKDGVMVVRSDVVGGQAVHGLSASDAELDREQIAVPDTDSPVLDDFGDPVLGEDGQPLYNDKYVDGENPHVHMGTRYLFQWVSEEEFANVKVNKVGYMQEGWMADRWDYAYADPNGGYVLISMAPALAKYAQVTDEQAAIHNASVRAAEAAGELSAEEAAELLITETVTTDETTGAEVIKYAVYRRPNLLKVVIPVDGIMYRYGYLDYSGAAVVDMHFGKFCHLLEDAMLYGRHADYQAYARTFNFTATGLETKNSVYEGESFYVREEAGKYVVEIKQGANVKPSEVINILGMLGGFGIVGKPSKEAGSNLAAVVSYKQSEAAELEYTMDIDGIPTMRPIVYAYETPQAAIEDFLAAFGAHIGVSTDVAGWSGATYGKITEANVASFFEANSSWAWFKNYYEALFTEVAAAEGFTAYTAWQPNGVRFGLPMLHAGAKHGSWPYSPDFSKPSTVVITDYSPEKSYRYNTWEDFVADFIKDFNEFVYGKDQITDAISYWDQSYTADTAIQAKQIEFFTTEKWAWFGEELDAGIKAANWTSYDKTHYYYYRCNVWEYITKTKRTSWPASCGSFHEMADPVWVGVPLEKDYNKVVFDASNYVLFDSFDLQLEVSNKATGIVDSMEMTFQVVEHFTPVIKVDTSALGVALGQTSINLYDAVSAWDMEYKASGDGVYGSDISRQYLEFVYPEGFDPNNLRGGEWTIVAVAKCPYETGIEARTSFKVTVIDENAPIIRLNGAEFYVAKGSQLTAYDILAYAYDDVDGDLLRNANVDFVWANVDFGGYDPENSFVGEQFEGSITVYDSSTNSTKMGFTLIVTGVDVEFPETSTPDADDKVEVEDESCISFAYVSSFIAAAGLALLILKKRH